jgi:3-oxoacyl-[acyl-carrier protein] reductase
MMRVNYPTQADLDAVLEKIPVRRLGTIDDVANLAIFWLIKTTRTSRGKPF